MNLKTNFLIILSFFIITQTLHAQNIIWPDFMQKQELRWNAMGKNYYQGLILGNGLLGLNIYALEANVIRFNIGRTDVVENRTTLYPNINKLYTQARLPIGYFKLETKGTITSAVAHLDIYNAIARGKIITTLGEIKFSAYVSALSEVMEIKLQNTGGEKTSGLNFVPEISASPRLAFNMPDKPIVYKPNPPVIKSSNNGHTIFHQLLLNGGGYATAFSSEKANGTEKIRISIGYDGNNQLDEIKWAESMLNQFAKNTDTENFNHHKIWWNSYYKKSFVSLPDKRMESFYWAQLYKIACLTRANKPMIDLMGPWTSATPWPAIWWNLNVQLTYAPIAVINHTEFYKPLLNTLAANSAELKSNVPAQWQYNSAFIGRSSSYSLRSRVSNEDIVSGKFEAANLTWAMYYCYQYYLYSHDETTLRATIFPLLKRSTNFLIHLLEKDKNGIYHFPVSVSPEYNQNAADANYVIASLKWALKTLPEINKRFRLNDPDQSKWLEVNSKLTDYPKDSTGFLIGKNLPLEKSHRHYSHLLMIYPYHLINWENKTDKPVIEKSLSHWISLKGALQGYTFTGAASIYATMGRGDSAINMLNQLFDKYIKDNTLYQESGPVIETPLSAVSSITELLLQSWGNKIRIFPAVPSSWHNLSFQDLLAEGAFEVSAKYENNKTTYIKIKSNSGGICTVQTDMKPYAILNASGAKRKFSSEVFEHKQLIKFSTEPGEIIEFTNSKEVDKAILPVPYEYNTDWYWGVKAQTRKGKQ